MEVVVAADHDGAGFVRCLGIARCEAGGPHLAMKALATDDEDRTPVTLTPRHEGCHCPAGRDHLVGRRRQADLRQLGRIEVRRRPWIVGQEHHVDAMASQLVDRADRARDRITTDPNHAVQVNQ